MPDVIEQLRRYGEAVERQATRGEPLLAEPRDHKRFRLVSLRAAAVCLILAVSVATFAARGQDESLVEVTGPDPRMVFSQRTGTVLLFSDGLDGVLAIDLDSRIAGRRVVEGERAGDQQFRLTHTADALVVGWGEIYAAPLSGGPSRLIDEATIYFPAAEPGEVWTLDYPGGGIGSGSATLRRVDLSGDVLFASNEFETDRYEPLVGVPGGIAVATSDGIAIWNAETATIGGTYGSGRPASASSNGKQLAWCGDTCDDLRLVELPMAGGPTPQHVNAAAAAPAFSPDGRQLAFLEPGGAGSNLIIKDIQTREQTSVATGLDQHGKVQWASDGRQLFYASDVPGQVLALGRYDAEAGTWEEEQILVSGGRGLVALDRSAANAFLPEQPGELRDCRAPGVYPSGRSGPPCGFGF